MKNYYSKLFEDEPERIQPKLGDGCFTSYFVSVILQHTPETEMMSLVGNLIHKDSVTQLDYMRNWSKTPLNNWAIELKTLTSIIGSEPSTSISRTTKSRQPNQQPNPLVLAQVDRQAAQPGNDNNSYGQVKYRKNRVDPLVVATNTRILQIFNNFKCGGAQNFTPPTEFFKGTIW